MELAQDFVPSDTLVLIVLNLQVLLQESEGVKETECCDNKGMKLTYKQDP
jgi:hypothetical protein